MEKRGHKLFVFPVRLLRSTTVIAPWRWIRGFVILTTITSLLYVLPSLPLTLRWKIVDEQGYLSSNLNEEYHLGISENVTSKEHITESNSNQSNSIARETISATKSNLTPVMSTKDATLEAIRPTVPYKERFRFIHSQETLSLDGPIYNEIPAKLTWREELSQVKICDSEEPFILAVVPSAVKSKMKRDIVRKTWANETLYNRTGIRAVFVLGATVDKALQDEVDNESKKNKDIIQYNFIDSYGNLTYKTMAWLKWVTKHCPEVPFVAKIDDDVIVNPFTLNNYLHEQLNKVKTDDSEAATSKMPRRRPELANPATNVIYGKLITEGAPHRDGKWAVPKVRDIYPEDKFPPFVLGPAYILGGNVAGRLLKYAPYTPLLWLEDVYTTGLVAHAAQVKHVQAMPLYITRGTSDYGLANGEKAFWVEHGLKDKSFVWQKIINSS